MICKTKFEVPEDESVMEYLPGTELFGVRPALIYCRGSLSCYFGMLKSRALELEDCHIVPLLPYAICDKTLTLEGHKWKLGYHLKVRVDGDVDIELKRGEVRKMADLATLFRCNEHLLPSDFYLDHIRFLDMSRVREQINEIHLSVGKTA
jgi:hypothetical protein